MKYTNVVCISSMQRLGYFPISKKDQILHQVRNLLANQYNQFGSVTFCNRKPQANTVNWAQHLHKLSKSYPINRGFPFFLLALALLFVVFFLGLLGWFCLEIHISVSSLRREPEKHDERKKDGRACRSYRPPTMRGRSGSPYRCSLER
jgi:hypothetical protein